MSTPAPRLDDSLQRPPDWDSYYKHAQQSWTDKQTSSDDFDKSLLTFSSGTLALSLAFVKDIVPLKDAVHLPLLYLSWAAFAGCILFTIFGYPLSQLASHYHAKYLYEFYINRIDSYFNKESIWVKLVRIFACIAGALFLLGMVLTVVFAYENISRSKMSNEKNIPQNQAQLISEQRGRNPIAMNPVCIAQDARNPTLMTPVQTQAPVSTPQAQSVAPVQNPAAAPSGSTKGK